MAGTRFSYQRLRNGEGDKEFAPDSRMMRWSSVRLRLKKVHIIRKRLKMKKIRRKARVVMTKVLKRLKESRAHFGHLFAGNYLFLQVNPTPLKSTSR